MHIESSVKTSSQDGDVYKNMAHLLAQPQQKYDWIKKQISPRVIRKLSCMEQPRK